MEEFLTHNQVKAAYDYAIMNVVNPASLGRYVPDRMRLTNTEANLNAEPDGLFFSNHRPQCVRSDFSAIFFLRPRFQITIKLIEYPLQSFCVQPRSLPKLGRRWLDERMRVESVALEVLGCDDVEAESRTDKGAACFRIRVGRQHPAFVFWVTKDIHQTLQIEFDVGILKVKQ